MRYPEFLKAGGSIGYIAPSFGPTVEPYTTLFQSVREKFACLGYSQVLGPNCFATDGVGKSSTPENCGAEINDFFTNDRCDVIISCGGGETMCEDLPFVDFEAMAKATPKWYMGYSDNTNLVFTLPTLCDTAAIYGPNICDFGQKPLHPAVDDAWNVLTGRLADNGAIHVHSYPLWEKDKIRDGENPFEPYNVTEPFEMVLFDGKNVSTDAEVQFSGRLIGGCLDCLVNLCGTRFDKVSSFLEKYKDDGFIWFMEACDFSAMSIRRALWQLDNAGWFKYAKGFLIGRPCNYDSNVLGVDRHNAVLVNLAKYGVPILMDLDIGHLPPQMPIIAGSVGVVDAGHNRFEMDMFLR